MGTLSHTPATVVSVSPAPERPHWVSSREAAQRLGVTRDYIGRLCREGALVCQRDPSGGRAWEVLEGSLEHYAVRMREAKEALRRQQQARLQQWWQRHITPQWIALVRAQALLARRFGYGLVVAGITLFLLGWIGSQPSSLWVRAGHSFASLPFFSRFVQDASEETWLSPRDGARGAPGIVVQAEGQALPPSQVASLFSEPVRVKSDDSRSGSIQPMFSQDDRFLYLMVPVISSSTGALSNGP